MPVARRAAQLDVGTAGACGFDPAGLVRCAALCGLLLAGTWAGAPRAEGGDWPTWRCDAARTACCREDLPDRLHLQWVRKLPPQITAWKDESVMRFDESYLPIVLGNLMFVGSTRSDSLTAYDVESGAERWRFYCGGPVRTAPAGWKGKVYVAADDGLLYCLAAADGRLLWKFRGALADRRLLGNERLISTWPARGGPVIGENAVYFAVGVWPLMGTSVYALDAESGRVLWQNDAASFTYRTLPHVGAEGYSGLAPQGHLVLLDDLLLVPGSRYTPAMFDRRSGKFLGYAKGGGPALAAQGRLLVAGGAVYDLRTGEQIHHAGGTDGSANFGRTVLARGMWYSEAGLLDPTRIEVREIAVKVSRKDDSPLDKRLDETLPQFKEYRTREPLAPGYDPEKDSVAPGTTGPEKPALKPVMRKIAAGTISRVGTLSGVPWLSAGSRVVITTKGKARTVETPGESPELELARDSRVQVIEVTPRLGIVKHLWSGAFDGIASEVLAAGGRLFVVTREGSIYCFGPQEVVPRVHKLPEPPAPAATEWTATAAALLEAAGTKDGYCLVWGLNDGGLVEALVEHSNLHVVALDRDERKVEALRRRLDAAGLYGTRAAAIAGDPRQIELAPYFASLIVSEDWDAAGPQDAATLRKVAGPLRPYGGKACFPGPRHEDLRKWLKESGLAGYQLKRRGETAVLERAGPLPGSAPWLGENADAGNTRSSRDQLVMAPLGVLWYGNDLSNRLVLPRHGEGPVEQVVGGRLFIQGPDSLSAVDVYTGRLLWTRSFPGIGDFYNRTYHQLGAHSIGGNFYAVADAVYVAHDGTCYVLDPATGAARREIRHHAVPLWQFLMVYQDLLIAGAHPTLDARRRPSFSPTSSKEIVVMNRLNGRILWSRTAAESFRHYGICAGRGRIYCIDRPAPEFLVHKSSRADVSRLYALDAHSGRVIWETDVGVSEQLSYSEEHDVLLAHWAMSLGRSTARDVLPPTAARRGADGELLWTGPDLGASQWLGKWGAILNDTTIYTQSRRAFDLLSGAEITWYDAQGGPHPWFCPRGHGCSPIAGSRHLLTFRSGCASFYDLKNEGGTGSLGGFRSGCTSNLIAADGVLSAPDYTRTCTCAYDNRSSLALVHSEDVEYWTVGATPVPGRIGYNFGAPGDRRAADGTLWLSAPAGSDLSYGKTTPVVTVPTHPRRFCYHSLRVSAGPGWKWVAASGLVGLRSAAIPLVGIDAYKPMRVRLYFMEPEHEAPGKRVFSVSIGKRELIRDLDIFREAGGRFKSLVRELDGLVHDGATRELPPAATPYLRPGTLAGPQPVLDLRFQATAGEPLLCGIEVIQAK